MSTSRSSDIDISDISYYDSDEPHEGENHQHNTSMQFDDDSLPDLIIEYVPRRIDDDESESFYESLKKEIIRNMKRDAGLPVSDDSNFSSEYGGRQENLSDQEVMHYDNSIPKSPIFAAPRDRPSFQTSVVSQRPTCISTSPTKPSQVSTLIRRLVSNDYERLSDIEAVRQSRDNSDPKSPIFAASRDSYVSQASAATHRGSTCIVPSPATPPQDSRTLKDKPTSLSGTKNRNQIEAVRLSTSSESKYPESPKGPIFFAPRDSSTPIRSSMSNRYESLSAEMRQSGDHPDLKSPIFAAPQNSYVSQTSVAAQRGSTCIATSSASPEQDNRTLKDTLTSRYENESDIEVERRSGDPKSSSTPRDSYVSQRGSIRISISSATPERGSTIPTMISSSTSYQAVTHSTTSDPKGLENSKGPKSPTFPAPRNSSTPIRTPTSIQHDTIKRTEDNLNKSYGNRSLPTYYNQAKRKILVERETVSSPIMMSCAKRRRVTLTPDRQSSSMRMSMSSRHTTSSESNSKPTNSRASCHSVPLYDQAVQTNHREFSRYKETQTDVCGYDIGVARQSGEHSDPKTYVFTEPRDSYKSKASEEAQRGSKCPTSSGTSQQDSITALPRATTSNQYENISETEAVRQSGVHCDPMNSILTEPRVSYVSRVSTAAHRGSTCIVTSSATPEQDSRTLKDKPRSQYENRNQMEAGRNSTFSDPKSPKTPIFSAPLDSSTPIRRSTSNQHNSETNLNQSYADRSLPTYYIQTDRKILVEREVASSPIMISSAKKRRVTLTPDRQNSSMRMSMSSRHTNSSESNSKNINSRASTCHSYTETHDKAVQTNHREFTTHQRIQTDVCERSETLLRTCSECNHTIRLVCTLFK